MFIAARNWNLKLVRRRALRSSTGDDASGAGTMTFWTIVETMAGHDVNHLEQIERIAGEAVDGC